MCRRELGNVRKKPTRLSMFSKNGLNFMGSKLAYNIYESQKPVTNLPSTSSAVKRPKIRLGKGASWVYTYVTL